MREEDSVHPLRRIHEEFLLYFGSGIFAAIAHYGALITLVEKFDIQPVRSSTIGFILGALVSYSFNYKITFRSRKRHIETATRFFLVAVAGAGLNALTMSVTINQANLNYLFAQFVATVLVLVWNYSINKLWTFN